MIAIAKGETVGPGNALLIFYSTARGRMFSPASLAYRIFDVSTDAKRATPLQVFPATAGTFSTVDLSAAKIGVGRYAATWTAPDGSEAALGRYEIEWFYALQNPVTGHAYAPATTRKAFEVLSAAGASNRGPQYAFVTDIRTEGLCSVDALSDAALQMKITLASRMIERVTGRFFEPRRSELSFSGPSQRKLFLGHPIIGLEGIAFGDPPDTVEELDVELDDLRVFNRHLSQNMTDPDDREDPRIEFAYASSGAGLRFTPYDRAASSVLFPLGVQNVQVHGVFGYTDPDGSPWGETPLLIQHVTKLIVAREIPKLSDADKREDTQQRWRVTQDRARDVSVDLEAPRKWGKWFGDPEIDSILCSFVRPPAMGAV